jgi:hypothetical protein
MGQELESVPVTCSERVATQTARRKRKILCYTTRNDAPRIVRFLQLQRHDGLPPLPLETVRRHLLRHAFVALRSHAHDGVSRLDERAIEIERCDARGRGRGEMHAMETAARRAERGREPPKRLRICLSVTFSSLLEDREHWPLMSENKTMVPRGIVLDLSSGRTFWCLGIRLAVIPMCFRTAPCIVPLPLDRGR